MHASNYFSYPKSEMHFSKIVRPHSKSKPIFPSWVILRARAA